MSTGTTARSEAITAVVVVIVASAAVFSWQLSASHEDAAGDCCAVSVTHSGNSMSPGTKHKLAELITYLLKTDQVLLAGDTEKCPRHLVLQ